MPTPLSLPHVETRAALHERGWSDGQILRARRRGDLVALLPGTYAASQGGGDRRDLLLAAALAHYGPEATAVLGTAARLHGLPEPWPDDGLVHVALPPGAEQARAPGLGLHTWLLAPTEIEELRSARVTSASRTLADLMCLTDRLSAVAAADAALRAGLVDENRLHELSGSTIRRRGAARSRSWWALADRRAESPLETRIRLRATDGGYRPHELQLELDAGGHRYRADLAWRQPNGRWLIAEADGRSVHELPVALLADRVRSNDLSGRGDVDLLRFTWRDSASAHPVPRALSRFLGPPGP